MSTECSQLDFRFECRAQHLLFTQEASRDDAAAAEAQDDGVPQLFSFLNRAVGDGSEAAAVRRRSSGEDKSARWVQVQQSWPVPAQSVSMHHERWQA